MLGVFEYSEGASHVAQAIAVISGQTDIASDYDRNLDVLTSLGRIDKSKLKIIWQSNPLPNDPIALTGVGCSLLDEGMSALARVQL